MLWGCVLCCRFVSYVYKLCTLCFLFVCCVIDFCVFCDVVWCLELANVAATTICISGRLYKHFRGNDTYAGNRTSATKSAPERPVEGKHKQFLAEPRTQQSWTPSDHTRQDRQSAHDSGGKKSLVRSNYKIDLCTDPLCTSAANCRDVHAGEKQRCRFFWWYHANGTGCLSHTSYKGECRFLHDV